MRTLAPDGRDAERFRARLRAERRYDDVVVIEVEDRGTNNPGIGFLTQDEVAAGWGFLTYVGCPVPSAVKPGTFIRLWGGGHMGDIPLGATLLEHPPVDGALVRYFAEHHHWPYAVEGEHLWLREP